MGMIVRQDAVRSAPPPTALTPVEGWSQCTDGATTIEEAVAAGLHLYLQLVGELHADMASWEAVSSSITRNLHPLSVQGKVCPQSAA